MYGTAAPEEEQGKEVEVVAADPNPEQQEEKDVAGDQDSEEHEAATATKIEEVSSKLQQLRVRISQRLWPAGPHHTGVVNGDYERRCLAFLETELTIIAAFLMTLSPQHYLEDEETKSWLEDCLFKVPDLANRVFSEVDPSRHRLLRRASQCFRLRKPYVFPNFMELLWYFSDHRCRYKHLLHTSSDLRHTPQLATAEAEAGAVPLVGIDRPAKKMLRWLSHQGTMDRDRLRVMSIVGPIGIGKTTLAVELRNRLRHETSEGRCYFHCNFMAQVTRGDDRNVRLLQDILSQVLEPAAAAWPDDEEVLVHLVSENLRDKRYFIIIDDIWEATDWEKIKGAFPNNNLDNRILVTTRSTSIARACCSDSYGGLVHEMKPLSKIDSERLFLAKAIGSGDGCLPNNMKLLCDEILRKCDGIPLFIISMADWLKGQQLQKQHPRLDEDEEHEGFAMHYEEQVPWLPARLEQALSTAFNNDFCNDDMRLLLLYMSMFPSGYKFDKDHFILKLIHEGLIHWRVLHWLFIEENQSLAMLAAEMLFSMLVDRNVITSDASNWKYKQDGAEVCHWQVNHFMHQFLASKSAEMGFIFSTTTFNLVPPAAPATERSNETTSRVPRRLALHHPDPQLPSLLETMDLSQTRSLAVSGAVSWIPLDKFVNLVVLDLEGWENLKDEDLVQITELPLELFELADLSYLDLRGTRISQLRKQIFGQQHNLLGLLLDDGAINSVETAARVPHHVQRLHLETLATVDLTQQPANFVRDLGDLYFLKVLAVTWSSHQCTDTEYCKALLSSIRWWKNLKSLTIHCGLGCSMDFLASSELLDSFENFRAPRELEKFKVTAGRFACVPPWISELTSLAFVQITVCKQVTDDLKILEDLPFLQCLILGLDFIPGQPIAIGNEGFHELQIFSVDCPMPWLTFITGAMPKLTYLQLMFSSTPASEICVPSGIINLHRLTEVALCYNAQYINSPSIKMTLEAVTKQVAEHCNPMNLFINGIEQDDVQEVNEVTEITIRTSSSTNAEAEYDAQAVGKEATAAIQCEITEAES